MKRRLETVYGAKIKPPRLTYSAVGWGLLYIGVPILLVSLALDFAVYGLFGVCTGLICAF